jgi:ADP-ribose pyrophosphatase YjhB (NUDIX family)
MNIFEYCPRCKSSDISFDDRKKFECSACSFTYFHNVATAAAAILEFDKKIILIKRAREPGKGKLDLPGGFIDPEETVEDGLNRELQEELGITLEKMKYLGSFPNVYKYKDVTYNTCDLFFCSKIESIPKAFEQTEISELVLINPAEIIPEDFAFKSTPKGLELFINAKDRERY